MAHTCAAMFATHSPGAPDALAQLNSLKPQPRERAREIGKNEDPDKLDYVPICE